MACTLEDLHQAQFKMMCTFGEYCEKHKLNYALHGGTLLGAIRHNDFIPWDDDVDMIMDIRSFNKLVKLLKKEPMKGLFFQWISTETDHPYSLAKVRINNTRMAEWPTNQLNIHQGIYIDLFVYLDKPKTEFSVKLQELILKVFTYLGGVIVFKIDETTFGKTPTGKLDHIFKHFSNKTLCNLRKFLFIIISHFGNKNSEYVRDFDYNGEHNFKEPRSCFEPTILHKFGDSEFRIPKNYDQLLRIIYGNDYMTPKNTHTHVNLQNVELNLSGE